MVQKIGIHESKYYPVDFKKKVIYRVPFLRKWQAEKAYPECTGIIGRRVHRHSAYYKKHFANFNEQ